MSQRKKADMRECDKGYTMQANCYYYELDFANEYGMAIKSARKLSMDDKEQIEAWLVKMGDKEYVNNGLIKVVECDLQTVTLFYNCDNIDNWPIFE